MFRTAIWFLYFFAYQAVMIPDLIKAERLEKSGLTQELEAHATQISVTWATRLLKLAGCSFTVEGIENIPTDRAVLFTPNHQSNFDIPLLMSVLGRPAGFIAKESMGKFPLINRWMVLLHCVFIRRGSPRDAAAAINKGIANLKAGHSMIVFPEGTRSPDGSLLEFKAGSLKLATKAQVPIVPVAIDGSIDMMKKGSLIIRPAKVHITVLAPIMPETYETADTGALSETVRSAVEARLKQA